MQLLILFMVASFVVGGLATRRDTLPRPVLVMGACIMVGALYYSRRFI